MTWRTFGSVDVSSVVELFMSPCPQCGREVLWSSRCTMDKVTTQPYCWCLLAVTE